MSTNNTYTPTQNLASTDINAWYEAVAEEKLKAEAAGTQAVTNAQLQQLYGQIGMTEAQGNNRSQQGIVNPDGSVTGGTQRPVAAGTSGADEHYMTDGEYALLQQYKQEYANAATQAEKDAAHAKAEALRARYNYSGGTDGSMYLTGMDYLHNDTGYGSDEHSGGGSGSGSGGATGGGTANDLRDLLSQWQDSALKQQEGRIDYAVQQAITELERALEDAQPQFKEQAESVAKEERQALDNSALYAEARGDKGGIGKEQYNEIQAAAAQNRLAVQQAQTKLSTDTARQIADLRAQGEFEKADAALEIAQTYLSQLISLEQWAAEYNLSVDQFNENVRQWEAEFQLAMQQFQVDTDLAYGQLTGVLGNGQLTLSAKKELASMGEALLSTGVMPSAEQLDAMGMTQSQAQAYLTAKQLEAAKKNPTGAPYVSIYDQMQEAGVSEDEAYAYLIAKNYTDTEAKQIANTYRTKLRDAQSAAEQQEQRLLELQTRLYSENRGDKAGMLNTLNDWLARDLVSPEEYALIKAKYGLGQS